MIAIGTKKTNAVELRTGICKYAYVRKAQTTENLCLLNALRKQRKFFWQKFSCSFVEMIKVKMGHNDGINVKQILNRARQIAIRIAATSAGGVWDSWIGTLS